MIGTFALAAGIAYAQSTAAPGRIRADPADLPLLIQGELGQSDFRTSIRLEAKGARVPEVGFLPTKLVLADDSNVAVPRSNVTLEGVTALKPDDAADAVIVVSAVPRAGAYRGEVEIFARGRRSQGLRLPLTVIVLPRPDATDQIQVDANPFRIDARIGQESSFSDTLIVSSSGRTIKGFQVIAERLRSDDGEITLPRSAVEHVGGSRELPESEYVPIELKVKGITKPGLYSGDVLFIPRGQPRERGTQVTVVVDAKGTPTLTGTPEAGSDKVTVSLTRCLLCRVERLLGSSEEDELEPLDFDTPPRVPVTITSGSATGRGEKTDRALSKDQIGVTWGATEGNTVTVTVTGHANDIRPDLYTGRLKLTLDGEDTPVIVPLTIAVKDGPLNAFLALFVGAIGAVFFRYWTRQNDRWRAHEAIDRALGRAKEEAPEDWQRVEHTLDQARAAVGRGESEVAAEMLKSVNKRVDVLVATRRIEQLFPEYEERLEHVRDLIETGDDAGAAAALTAIRTEIAAKPGPKQEVDAAMATALKSCAKAAEYSGSASASPNGRAKRLSRSAAYYVGGVNDWTAATARRFLAAPARLVIGLVTLAVVTVVALQAQYFGSSQTFGADPFWDYFALVVAGFTGAVTQKVVANAKPAKA